MSTFAAWLIISTAEENKSLDLLPLLELETEKRHGKDF